MSTDSTILEQDSARGLQVKQPYIEENDVVNIKGLLYGLSAAIFYSCSQPIFKMIFLKYYHVSSFEINYWNALIMFVTNYFIVKIKGAFVLDIPRKFHSIILLRSICGFVGYLGQVTAVKYMPVSTASCIFFTCPIWTALLAFFFLKEKITKFDVIQILSAFIGILIINNPFGESENPIQSLETQNDAGTSFQDTKIYSSTDRIVGSLISLMGAIGASTAFLTMRIMKNDIHYSVSPFWWAMGVLFLSPLFSINHMRQQEVTQTYTLELILLTGAVSITSMLGQIFQSRAYQLEKAARVASLNYIQIVIAFLWDFLFFNTKLQWTDITGSIIIILVIFLITVGRALGYIN